MAGSALQDGCDVAASFRAVAAVALSVCADVAASLLLTVAAAENSLDGYFPKSLCVSFFVPWLEWQLVVHDNLPLGCVFRRPPIELGEKVAKMHFLTLGEEIIAQAGDKVEKPIRAYVAEFCNGRQGF